MADAGTVEDERTEKPERRKIDLPCPIEKAQEEDEDKLDSNKRQKTETPSEKNGSISVAAGENVSEMEEHLKISAAVEEEDEEDDDDYNAEQDEDGHEETENVDRKGKGILLDDKGKGKMLADSEDDDSEELDDDDDDDSSDDSDCDLPDGLDESDMEDDPLAEVDLDNILPSRTRQRRVQPGVRISSDSQKGNDA
ncbi:hypothetical protein CDL12_10457 [Handroanthus impetiginosus]|uniref:Uncharacterized protein n=1 Tax=Handroanthus impetiginosus TaxID=429701 RepID=A0A2G9HH76_9LAMI|nr:hypothetical protein CDL12_10457 [Handroanthus impetiginosus]